MGAIKTNTMKPLIVHHATDTKISNFLEVLSLHKIQPMLYEMEDNKASMEDTITDLMTTYRREACNIILGNYVTGVDLTIQE